MTPLLVLILVAPLLGAVTTLVLEGNKKSSLSKSLANTSIGTVASSSTITTSSFACGASFLGLMVKVTVTALESRKVSLAL